MKMINFQKIYPSIYHVTTQDLPTLGTMFCRMQEFYESPHQKYHGQIFDFEEFLKWYQQEYQKNYLEEWEGYNLPSKVVSQFRMKMDEILRLDPASSLVLSNPESWLIAKLSQIPEEKYYVIGTKEGDTETFQHELAHAFYALDPRYQKDVKIYLEDSFIKKLISPVTSHLKSIGYCDQVLTDELNAYLMFDQPYLEGLRLWKKDFNSLQKMLLHRFKFYLKQVT